VRSLIKKFVFNQMLAFAFNPKFVSVRKGNMVDMGKVVGVLDVEVGNMREVHSAALEDNRNVGQLVQSRNVGMTDFVGVFLAMGLPLSLPNPACAELTACGTIHQHRYHRHQHHHHCCGRILTMWTSMMWNLWRSPSIFHQQQLSPRR